MGFGQAISTCFSKYVTFQGRARRSEFWWWVLFIVIGSTIAGFLDGLFSTTYSFGGAEDVTVYTQTGWIGVSLLYRDAAAGNLGCSSSTPRH